MTVTYEKEASKWFALLDLREGAIPPAADILALGRLLGDSIPEDQEESYISQYRTAAEEAQLRKEMEAPGGAPQAVLSAQKSAQLSSLSFDAEARLYALWDVQAQVARATGWNIVSDCFWQGPRQLTEATSMLEALVQSCTAEPGRLPGLSGGARFRTLPWAVAWEWGDAGSFLRFRSVARGLWRASLLPTRVLTEADQYLEPYWRQAMEVHGPEDDLPSWESQEAVTQLIRIARELDDVQLEYGGHLLYEDPTAEEGAWRHQVREAFFWPAAENPDVFRLMLSFDDAQWQLVSGPEGMQGTSLMGTQGLQLQRAVRREGEFLAPDDYPTLRIRTVGILPTNAYPGFRIRPGDPSFRLELFRRTGSEADRWPWIVWRWPERMWAYPYRPGHLSSRPPAAGTSP